MLHQVIINHFPPGNYKSCYTICGFLRVLQYPPPIANILWQVALKTVILILTPTRKCIHKTVLSFLTQCFLHQIKFIYDGISICLIFFLLLYLYYTCEQFTSWCQETSKVYKYLQ